MPLEEEEEEGGSWIFDGLSDPDYWKEEKDGPWTQPKGTFCTIILSGKDEQKTIASLCKQERQEIRFLKSEDSGLVCPSVCLQRECEIAFGGKLQTLAMVYM